METLLEQPQTFVRLLVHEDVDQTQRIIVEATTRREILNSLIDKGIRQYEIEDLVSQNYIEKMLWERHLQLNKPMAREYAEGKKQSYLVAAYTLPDTLIRLKGTMEAWVNYESKGSKFRHLKVVNQRYQLDEESMEREFIAKTYKLYVGQEAIDDIKELSTLRDIVVKRGVPLHGFLSEPYWAKIFCADSSIAANRLPPSKVMFRKTYFMNKRYNPAQP